MTVVRAGLVVVFLACGPVVAVAGDPAPLIAHRAVYDLTLGKTSGAKAPATARGRIAFDFSGSPCEGYAMTFRQITELQPNDGPTRVSDMRSTTFEDGDGKTFRFKVKTDIDGVGQEESDGDAFHSADGALSVALKRPRPQKFDFDQGVLFPTEQLKRALAAARKGETTYETPVYDGSDAGDKVFDTLSVIGAPTTADPPEAAAQHEALRGVTRWPVRVSYFERGRRDDAPVYSLSFDLYDNGVSRALKLDYGDFVLNGEMTKFEPLPTKVCGK